MPRPKKEFNLVKIFETFQVLTLEQLCQRTRASRSTVLRRLNLLDCYTSYNHSGKFWTIQHVADFDARGLWFCKGARFSRYGNLKETLIHLIEQSDEGMTHEELASILHLRVHNTLLELVQERRLRRERVGPTFVYFSHKTSLRKEQVRRRRLLPKQKKSVPDNRHVLVVLAELIQCPQIARQQIVSRLQRRGVSISLALVDQVFEIYHLDKKRGLSKSVRSYVWNERRRLRPCKKEMVPWRNTFFRGMIPVVQSVVNRFGF